MDLKEKLNNLSEKFSTDLDIISLKALCNVPESEEVLFAITGTLQRLMEKYPDDKEILELLPKEEKISLEELIRILEDKYSGDIELITIKALVNILDGEDKEKAIKSCLERMLDKYPEDENIMEYLEIEDIITKEKNPNMVFVEGGTYFPSFYSGEKKVFDLYVNKYMVTEEDYLEIMGEDHSSFYFFGTKILPKNEDYKKPRSISWMEALEYCNSLSKKYNLKPVYIIENNELVGICQLDSEKVAPNRADFSKTEGYRLPTEVEWEWFAFGGKIAQDMKTFDKRNLDINEFKNIAWFKIDSLINHHDVGLKSENELGLYDVFGNMVEFVYDTCSEANLDDKKDYIFDFSSEDHVLRGGYECTDSITVADFPFVRQQMSHYGLFGILGSFGDTMRGEKKERKNFSKYKPCIPLNGCGFRVVRTANPKRK